MVAKLLDLTRAFDTIEPKILLMKLRSYRISEKLWKLINNYKSDRKTAVKPGDGEISEFGGQKYCET